MRTTVMNPNGDYFFWGGGKGNVGLEVSSR